MAALSSETPSHDNRYAATVYGARISSERTWQDVIRNPFGAAYIDSWFVVGALERQYSRVFSNRLTFAAEGQFARQLGPIVSGAPSVRRLWITKRRGRHERCWARHTAGILSRR
jgi:hypothetical protein